MSQVSRVAWPNVVRALSAIVLAVALWLYILVRGLAVPKGAGWLRT